MQAPVLLQEHQGPALDPAEGMLPTPVLQGVHILDSMSFVCFLS